MTITVQSKQPKFNTKRNDLGKPVLARLWNARVSKDQPATPLDLSQPGTTVRFKMRVPEGPTKVDAAAVIVDGINGIVRYDWISGDTDTAGIYWAEFEVTLPSGKPITAPDSPFHGGDGRAFILILIEEDVPPI